LTFKQSNWWQLLLNNKAQKIDISADMVVDNQTYTNVGVRFRGQTSYKWLPPAHEKKSFNIRTDAFVSGQDLYGYSNLNLNNGFHDPSFMREFLAYMIARRYGIAPKCNFVRLHLNNVYWGIYVNAQQPNSDMMKEWFGKNDSNRYRGFPSVGNFGNGRCALTWLGNNVQAYRDAYEVKQGDAMDLMNLCDVLNNTPTNQLQAALRKVFSVDQFYRYAIVMNAMLQTDSYIGSGKDHFLWVHEDHNDFHMFPFDLNESLGAEGQGSPTLPIWYNTTRTDKPAFTKTLQFPDWRARYVAHYRHLVEETFSWTQFNAILTKYRALISKDVARDTKKIYTTADFDTNVTSRVWGLGGRNGRYVWIPGIKEMIEPREKYLKGLPEMNAPRPTLSALAHSPTQPTNKDTVWVRVTTTTNTSKVTLFSRSKGSFVGSTMYDDGQHHDGKAGDWTWGASIAALPYGTPVDYYTMAATSTNVVRFLPANAELTAAAYRVDWPHGTSPIDLNEFVAKNNSGIQDEKQQYEDWLELYNASSQAVSVAGMYLTDDMTNATKWKIPTGYSIPAYGQLLIWCDEDGGQGPLHANFKLAAGGEEIGLFATDGQTLLDTFAFGQQEADIATGRLADGGAQWVTFPVPTPSTLNDLTACGSRAFSALDYTRHRISMTVTGLPKIGTTITLACGGGPASGAGLLYMAGVPAYLDIGPCVFLLNPLVMAGPFLLPFDAQGKVNAPLGLPNDPGLDGFRLWMQVLSIDSKGLTASNGTETLICK
jgi:hypothetical protein